MRCATLVVAACALLCGGCRTPGGYDFANYLAHVPRSIMVMPPLNESVEPVAPYVFLSTVSLPLAERGYYVFPVAVLDLMMKENGLPTPGEMHQVSLEKIDEVVGADAVLYPIVRDWGTEYQIINSSTTVAVTFRLVDVKSGAILWEASRAVSADSAAGSQGPISALISALLTQILNSASDPSPELCAQLCHRMFYDSHYGLPPGPLDPRHNEVVAEMWGARAKAIDTSEGE